MPGDRALGKQVLSSQNFSALLRAPLTAARGPTLTRGGSHGTVSREIL